MLIVFGFKVVFTTVGEGHFHCPGCGTDRHYRLRRARRWFSLFFIPVIPLKTVGTVVECSTCNRKYREEALERPTALETADSIGFGRRALAAHMVDVSDNTTVAREAAVSVMRESGVGDYDLAQLDVDRQTSDWERVLAWAEHLGSMLSAAAGETMLMGAARVAAADGAFSDRERSVLTDLGSALGLTPLHVDGVLAKAQSMSPHGNS